LDQLLTEGWTIFRACRSAPWPNEANLEISKIWLGRRRWTGSSHIFDGGRWSEASAISSALSPRQRMDSAPLRLEVNHGISFIGTYLWGNGFAISRAEAHDLLQNDGRNAEVLAPYINGKDLNESPCQRASRWVIDFREWPEHVALTYERCYAIVEERVRPARMLVERKRNRERWWIFGETRPGLYSAISGRVRVIGIAGTSRTAIPCFITTDQVIDKQIVIFAYSDTGHLGVLNSAIHWCWAVRYGSTMRKDLRYTPSDVFETFPQPEPQSGPLWDRIDEAGRELHEFRADLMIRTDRGLTKTYNRVHDPDEHDSDYERLRELHVALDHVVRDAYGWSDLELNHHHRETPQGMRFTVSPEAKDELLDRLLELNHERYAAEVAAGLHDKKKGKKAARPRKAGPKEPPPEQGSLM
jgi:hypothetical protein